jgi:hypothetical protein
MNQTTALRDNARAWIAQVCSVDVIVGIPSHKKAAMNRPIPVRHDINTPPRSMLECPFLCVGGQFDDTLAEKPRAAGQRLQPGSSPNKKALVTRQRSFRSQSPPMSWARSLHGSFEIILDECQVPLAHLKTVMPQHLLQGKHVPAVSQELNRKGVPELVRVRLVDAGSLAAILYKMFTSLTVSRASSPTASPVSSRIMRTARFRSAWGHFLV